MHPILQFEHSFAPFCTHLFAFFGTQFDPFPIQIRTLRFRSRVFATDFNQSSGISVLWRHFQFRSLCVVNKVWAESTPSGVKGDRESKLQKERTDPGIGIQGWLF